MGAHVPGVSLPTEWSPNCGCSHPRVPLLNEEFPYCGCSCPWGAPAHQGVPKLRVLTSLGVPRPVGAHAGPCPAQHPSPSGCSGTVGAAASQFSDSGAR